MKTKILAAVPIIFALVISYLVGTGLRTDTSAYIASYFASGDGSEITLAVSSASSAGHVRRAAVRRREGGTLYIDFRCAFGGINGKIGAKSVFTLPLDPDISAIALRRAGGEYETVLVRSASGEWGRPAEQPSVLHNYSPAAILVPRFGRRGFPPAPGHSARTPFGPQTV